MIEGIHIFGKRTHILAAAVLQISFSVLMLCLSSETEKIYFSIVAMLVMCGKAWMTPAIEALMIN